MSVSAAKSKSQDQAGVIAALSKPETFGLAKGEVQRYETHAAIVFVAAERAYKLKRAVRLPYLDFSDIESRHSFLKRELELNQPTAPQLYLGLQPLYRGAKDKISFAPPGDVVDWCLVMRAFPQEDLLQHRVEHRRFETRWVPDLVSTIVRMHAKAKISPSQGNEAHETQTAAETQATQERQETQEAKYRAIIGQLATALLEPEGGIEGDRVKIYVDGLQKTLAALRTRLDQRAADGFVRRCHGDLHLANIVLLDGKPVPFDALEFDEELATIDVLYDFAFLLMDFWHHDLKGAANAAFNLYMSVSPHADRLGDVAVLPFFMSLRAAIRAMVALQRRHATGAEGQARSHALDEARSLFSLAQSILHPKKPELIAVGGLSGTGKSTLAAGLAPDIGAAPGALHLRSDVERKRLFGVSPETRLGPKAYRPEITEEVYATLFDKAGDVLLTGHSVVVDAVFAKPEERARIEACASDCGVRFKGIWLEADASTLKQRVQARRNDASDATAAVVEKQLDYDIGEVSWHQVPASGTADQTLTRARHHLSNET